MKPIRLYIKQHCPYSKGAMRLLDEKGLPYEAIDVEADPRGAEEMARLSGGQTSVPQVFIGDEHLGGYSDLQELDRTRGVRTALL